MQTSIQTAPVSRKRLWAGRIVSALPSLFLLLDGVAKLVKPAAVVEGTVKLGYPETVSGPLYLARGARWMRRICDKV